MTKFLRVHFEKNRHIQYAFFTNCGASPIFIFSCSVVVLAPLIPSLNLPLAMFGVEKDCVSSGLPCTWN